MSESMLLLTLKKTGHVLAGVTRRNGGADLDVGALVGEALPVTNRRSDGDSGPELTARLPASVLEIKSAQLDSRVLAAPHDYVIDGGSALIIASDAGTSLVSGLDGDKLTLGTGGILPETEVLAVVAAIADPAMVRIQEGKFPTPLASLDIPLTVLPGDIGASVGAGDYAVMVALPGKRLHWVVRSVP